MPSNPLIRTFASEPAAEKWRKCCIKAADCCREMAEDDGIVNGKYDCVRNVVFGWTFREGYFCYLLNYSELLTK